MADAIIAPYIETNTELGSLKSETFTLENFVMTSSFSGSNQYNLTSNGYSSGAAVIPLYSAHPTTSHTRPDDWTRSFMPILCSSLCDVERCVIRINAKYKSGTGLANANPSLTTYIGLGWYEPPAEGAAMNDSGLFLSAAYKNSWTYGWIANILNGSVTATDESTVEYDLTSSSNYVGQAQSYWRLRNPNNIQLVLVSTNNGGQSTYSNSKWSASSGSLSFTVNATCTIIYTDYR